MKRHLFTALSILSLLMCVAVVVGWVRSYRVSDLFIWNNATTSAFAWISHGQFRFEKSRIIEAGRVHRTRGFRHEPREAIRFERVPGSRVHFRRYGFALVTGERWGEYHHALFLPAWFVLLAFSLAPVAWSAGAVRRLHRQRHALCMNCGYDLRASSERCPECGTAIVAGKATAPDRATATAQRGGS